MVVALIMKRDFNVWLTQFRNSIADYKYYIDFDIVYKNVESIKIELNIMNSLIGSKNIELDFTNLVRTYPQIVKCIPILLAKRESDIFCQDDKGGVTYHFDETDYRVIDENKLTKLAYFMRETGLFNLLQNRLISNLIDYVTGVETGLNSNGRKNRGGHLMEDLVESHLLKAGFIKDVTYFKEMTLSSIERKTGLDLSALSNFGSTVKRFDFVIITNKCIYACECNFYASGGSKLNETARSYKALALESKNIKGFKFVWFTDGLGWASARNNLKETFDILDTLYNIHDLENNILASF